MNDQAHQTRQESEMELSQDEINEMKLLMRRPKWAGSDRKSDKLRTKLKKKGATVFVRESWAWVVTEEGKRAMEANQ